MPKREPIQVVIKGEVWTITFNKSKVHDGRCYLSEHRINIDPRLRGAELMGTILHEIDHAWHEEKQETQVLEFEADVINAVDAVREALGDEE